MLVRRWDADLQMFIELNEADQVSYQEGARNFDFDRNLGAYPSDDNQKWLAHS